MTRVRIPPFVLWSYGLGVMIYDCQSYGEGSTPSRIAGDLNAGMEVPAISPLVLW